MPIIRIDHLARFGWVFRVLTRSRTHVDERVCWTRIAEGERGHDLVEIVCPTAQDVGERDRVVEVHKQLNRWQALAGFDALEQVLDGEAVGGAPMLTRVMDRL